MTDIARLAVREKAAEAAKGKADAAWRAAWWATTLALGEVTGRQAIGDAQRLVREVTGQSKTWVQERARAGRLFASLETGGAPPRMAVEVARAGVIVTQDVVDSMIEAEQDGVSLREFTAQITGSAWSDTPEGASEATIERIVAAHPGPVARAVIHHPPARQAAEEALLQEPIDTSDIEEDHRRARERVEDNKRSFDHGVYLQAQVQLLGMEMVEYGHHDVLRETAVWFAGQVDSLQAQDLTPEMFK